MKDLLQILTPRTLEVLQSKAYRPIVKLNTVIEELKAKTAYHPPETIVTALDKLRVLLERPNQPKYTVGVQLALESLPEALLRAAMAPLWSKGSTDAGTPPVVGGWFQFRHVLGSVLFDLDREYKLAHRVLPAPVKINPVNQATRAFIPLKTE